MTSRRELLRLLPVALAVPFVSLVPSPKSTDIPWIEAPMSMSEHEFYVFEKGLARLYPHYVICRTNTPYPRRVMDGGRS